METKEEINKRVSETYNRLMKDAKHGHYETLYHIVHTETEDLRTELAKTQQELAEAVKWIRLLIFSRPVGDGVTDDTLAIQVIQDAQAFLAKHKEKG